MLSSSIEPEVAACPRRDMVPTFYKGTEAGIPMSPPFLRSGSSSAGKGMILCLLTTCCAATNGIERRVKDDDLADGERFLGDEGDAPAATAAGTSRRCL